MKILFEHLDGSRIYIDVRKPLPTMLTLTGPPYYGKCYQLQHFQRPGKGHAPPKYVEIST
jgi:hypothetical protein